MAQIEVEERGFLTKEQYYKLIDYLDVNASRREVDHRETDFFMIPGCTLKVAQQISKNKAKIALKVGKIEQNAQEEYEISILPEEFAIAVNIFKKLGFTEVQYTTQERLNYIYRGYEISVKWSEFYEYHFEMEKMVDSESEVSSAKKELAKLAKELNLRLITEFEFRKFCDEIDQKHRENVSLGKPLYVQFQEKKTEHPEVMDKNTLQWIKINFAYDRHFQLKKGLTLSENDVALIRHYSPKASFFLRSDSANSIHGLNHIWRVMVNVILICKYYKINNYLPYLIAASIHDVRRDDDRTDDSHGQKAWEWFAQEHQDILAKLSKKDQEIIRVSVSYHNVNFNKIDSAILEKYLSVINIIKAADGLDRYRLPGKEFWPREEKMSLPGLVFMKPACLRLVVESEELSFEKGVSLDNILEVAKNIYIL